MLYCYAKLSDEELGKVKAYEAETGKRALVLREVNVEADDLSADELSRLRELERELGYIAIVVK